MTTSSFGPKPLAAGFITGLMVGGLIMLLAGFVLIKGERAKVRRGWTLEYVVTAAVPIQAGMHLDMDLIQQQPMPAQFVTGSVVRPNQLRDALELRVRHDLERGDTLMWSALENPGETEVAKEAVPEAEDSAESETGAW